MVDWEERYSHEGYYCGTDPVQFLRDHLSLFPRGRALDVASGEGRNAVFLAEQGFRVEAVEKSKNGTAKARSLADQRGVRIEAICQDIESYPISENSYDLIVNLYYLNRSLTQRLIDGLKGEGFLVFETYTVDQLQFPHGPREPEHLLQPNELLHLFGGLRILFYRDGIFEENGRRSAIASLIARKTSLHR